MPVDEETNQPSHDEHQAHHQDKQRRVSPRVPHLGRRQTSTTGTTNRMVQHTKRIELNTLTSLVVNIREGYGRHRSLRKEQ